MKFESAGLLLAQWSLLLSCVIGCASRAEESIGGETHFLRRCGAASDVCGEFECVAELCTRPCSEDVHCAGLPGAMCAPRALATEGSSGGRCDVWCSKDEDCQAVSSSHRCESGACRAASFASAPPLSTPTPEPTRSSNSNCTSASQSNDQRVVLGDSFFATETPLASVLGETSRYRDYARLHFNALALGGRGLEDQYLLARAAGPVDTVVMNGGGADVLAGACETLDACSLLTEAAAAARELFQRFARDGVGQVLYVSYPDPLPPAVRERMDALRPLLEDACRRSSVPCHFLDLRPVFAGHYATYIQPDGLHPTVEGTEVVANTIGVALDALCLGR